MRTMSRKNEGMVVLERPFHGISRREIDQDALKVLYRLNRKGHTAYLVGGAVRDLLLGKTPKDFDVATDARPGQVKKLFANGFLIGRRFRLVHVRFKGGKIIEVATFRRQPDEDEDADSNNTFGTPEEDAFRRDVTINALFYDISTFSIIDYVGGLEDMEQERIRIIGDPEVRYREDPVRMWRVLRHAARLDFTIDDATAAAIAPCKELLGDCSGARLYEELNKDLRSGAFCSIFHNLHIYGLWPIILGDIGAWYAAHSEETADFLPVLQVLDEAVKKGRSITPEVCYSLLLWPWARAVLAAAPEGADKMNVLSDALVASGMIITMPKALRAGVVNTLLIVERMVAALESGRMRWALKKRARYEDAALVCVMVASGMIPPGPDPFDALFRQRHPQSGAPRTQKRRRPRRRRSGGSGNTGNNTPS